MAIEDEKRQATRCGVAGVSPLSHTSSAVNNAFAALRLAARQAAQHRCSLALSVRNLSAEWIIHGGKF